MVSQKAIAKIGFKYKYALIISLLGASIGCSLVLDNPQTYPTDQGLEIDMKVPMPMDLGVPIEVDFSIGPEPSDSMEAGTSAESLDLGLEATSGAESNEDMN